MVKNILQVSENIGSGKYSAMLKVVWDVTNGIRADLS
jgi:hypothetical protein